MKFLAAARHPGPAESIVPVVRLLREKGHAVTLIGMRNDTPDTRAHGGSAATFQRFGLDYSEMGEFGHVSSPVSLEASYVDALFARFRPERVLTGCSVDASGQQTGIEDALIEGARRHDVPSVQLVEAWEAWYPRKKGHIADRYAVLDQITKTVMSQRGAELERITITGNPNLDRFADASPIHRQTVRDALGITSERLIVYFGQAVARRGTPDDPKTLRWVVDAMGQDDRLVFSRHPRDERDCGPILAHAVDRLVETPMTSDRVLHGADVSISHYSTMLMKSSLLDIPSISIICGDDIYDLRNEAGGSPLTILGGVYEVNSQQDLSRRLSGKLTGLARAVKASLRVDGGSASRVVDLLLEP